MVDASRAETISKLRKKADLTRHIHGELESVPGFTSETSP